MRRCVAHKGLSGAFVTYCNFSCYFDENIDFPSDFEVNGLNFRGTNAAVFIIVSLFNRGQPLKEGLCSSGSKVFPFRVDPFLESFIAQAPTL